jgi:hypothetical protein
LEGKSSSYAVWDEESVAVDSSAIVSEDVPQGIGDTYWPTCSRFEVVVDDVGDTLAGIFLLDKYGCQLELKVAILKHIIRAQYFADFRADAIGQRPGYRQITA